MFLHCGTHKHQNSQRGTQITFFQPFKLASCELVVFIDMKTYVTEGGRNFKTFLKENYAIALDRSLRNGVLFMLAWVAWVACLRE